MLTTDPIENQAIDSLAPATSEVISIEQEAAEMNRGKTRQLIWLSSLLVMMVVGGGSWLKSIDEQTALADSALAVDAVGRESLGAFLMCALPDARLELSTPAPMLQTAFEQRIERAPRAYGIGLTQCGSVDGIQSALAQMAVPQGIGPKLQAARAAADAFEHRSAELSASLMDDSLPYDYVRIVPHTEKLALAFTELYERLGDLRHALTAAL
jgi:hypothetical protein